MSKQSDLISVSQGAAGDPLFIDTANNRVGVGTSSPPSPLVVAEGTGQHGFEVQPGTLTYVFAYDRATAGYSDLDIAGQILRFSTDNGTERARIDASGNLIVGLTTHFGSGKVAVRYTPGVTTGVSFYPTTDASTPTPLIFLNSSGSAVGSVVTSASATAYNTSSDYRLKENVTRLTNAADRLAQIPVHRFNFTADPDTTVDGFLAHEVQAFVPECVTGQKDAVETVEVTDEDGNVTTETRPVYQGIDQSKLVPLLTAALQEALQKIDALETRISALETN